MKKRNLPVAVAPGLVALGAILIGQAAATPWHTDPDAYFAGLPKFGRSFTATTGMRRAWIDSTRSRGDPSGDRRA